jgi:hypothetical protein
MATVQEKIEALVYWVAGSILLVTCAILGTPVWSTILTILNTMRISGTLGISSLHAVQPIPMMYYGFLVIFEIALILRTVFVVWSKTSYQQQGMY